MEYIKIGKITTTHGIKGELKIRSDKFVKTDLEDIEYLYLGENKIKLTIDGMREHKGTIMTKFKEYNNINDVLIFKDYNVYIDMEDRKPLEENEHFIDDLIGLEVYDTKDTYIGVVEEVMQGISNDVYIINNKELDKEYLIPAVKRFIVEINFDDDRMIIDPIDGMIE